MKKLTIKHRKLGRERAHGQFWDETNKGKENLIEIDPRLNPKEHCATLIHELTHAAFPEMSERKVMIASKLISEYLWKEGYRKR